MRSNHSLFSMVETSHLECISRHYTWVPDASLQGYRKQTIRSHRMPCKNNLYRISSDDLGLFRTANGSRVVISTYAQKLTEGHDKFHLNELEEMEELWVLTLKSFRSPLPATTKTYSITKKISSIRVSIGLLESQSLAHGSCAEAHFRIPASDRVESRFLLLHRQFKTLFAERSKEDPPICDLGIGPWEEREGRIFEGQVRKHLRSLMRWQSSIEENIRRLGHYDEQTLA